MGGIQAYQIIQYTNESFMTEIRLINNATIVPYLFYIVKVNRKQVTEYTFTQEKFVKEISVYNVLMKKDYTILIDPITIEEFKRNITLSYGLIPDIKEVMIVKEIFPNGLSHRLGVELNSIILGSVIKRNFFFLEGLESISVLLKRKQCNLTLYNPTSDLCYYIDYEKHRDENGQIKLGFQVELMTLEKFISQKDKIVQFEEKDYKMMYEEAVKVSQSQMSEVINNSTKNRENQEVDNKQVEEIEKKNGNNDHIIEELDQKSEKLDIDEEENEIKQSESSPILQRKSENSIVRLEQANIEEENEVTRNFLIEENKENKEINTNNFIIKDKEVLDEEEKKTISEEENILHINSNSNNSINLESESDKKSEERHFHDDVIEIDLSKTRIKEEYELHIPLNSIIDSNFQYIGHMENTCDLNNKNESKNQLTSDSLKVTLNTIHSKVLTFNAFVNATYEESV